MTANRQQLAGLSFEMLSGWEDVTGDFAPGAPPSFARPVGGVGVLEFHITRFGGGPKPDLGATALRALMAEFAREQTLIDGFNFREDSGETLIVFGEFGRPDGFRVALWYVTDGKNLAFVTYSTDVIVDFERHEADKMVRALRFEP